ncbi:MAG TPA: hypothetical protein PLZ24_16840 [Flavobacteriales bacterium]|nr:hypothetical protein [Flavobacteriales bacterium]
MENTTNDAPAQYITEIAGRNYMVDEVASRIQFLDSRFYKAGEDLYVPSVTTILEAYPKGAAYYDWLKKHGEDSDEIRDEAGRRGSVVHNLTEVYDYGSEINLMDENGGPKYKLSEWAMFERYVDFRDRFPANIHAIELNMVSAKLGYAGTLDRVMTIGDTTYLVDIKTSGAIYDTYWMQQAAYLNLLTETGTLKKMFPEEETEVKLAILWLNSTHRSLGKKDDIQGMGWKLFPQDKSTEELLDIFHAVKRVWDAKNKDIKPRLTSYSLTHKLESK